MPSSTLVPLEYNSWDAALSPFEVSALYLAYANRYGLSKPEASDPDPLDPEPSPPTVAAEPCDICEGQPIANPLDVINISGFPPESCGKAGVTINNLASQFGATPQQACEFAIPQVKEICCIAAEGSQAPPKTSTPAAPSPTKTDENSTVGAMADANPVASDGLSVGVIASIVVGSIALVALIIVVVYKCCKLSSSAEYDTNDPAIKAAIEDQKELDLEAEETSNGTSKDKK